jgi:hypothetical protein
MIAVAHRSSIPESRPLNPDPRPFMWPFLVAAGTIIAAAGSLIAWHVHTWKAARFANLTAGELKFAWEQYRWRMQTSAMLAAVGLLIGAGPWIAAPLAVLLYWLGVIVLILWIMLLAGADMLATRMHFSQIETEQSIRQVKLHAALEAEKRKRSNGHKS